MSQRVTMRAGDIIGNWRCIKFKFVRYKKRFFDFECLECHKIKVFCGTELRQKKAGNNCCIQNLNKNNTTLEEGYNKFVIKNETGCWGWSGCAPVNPGYGQFRYGAKRSRAHRASWILHYGAIPKGMCVLHRCDNRICSRPEHLFLGTHKDNNLDAIKKGRHPTLGKKGEENHKTKLSSDQVRLIKEMCKKEKSVKKIANLFNVSPGAIGGIKYGFTWRRVHH